jgi:hypothetical protein
MSLFFPRYLLLLPQQQLDIFCYICRQARRPRYRTLSSKKRPDQLPVVRASVLPATINISSQQTELAVKQEEGPLTVKSFCIIHPLDIVGSVRNGKSPRRRYGDPDTHC